MSDKIYTSAEIEEALSRAGNFLGPFDRPQMIAIIRQLRGELNDARATATAAKEVGTDMAVRQNEIIESLHASAKAKREKIAAMKHDEQAAINDSLQYRENQSGLQQENDLLDKVLDVLDEETP